MESTVQSFNIPDCTDLIHGQKKRYTSDPLNQLDILTNIELYLSNKLKQFCGKDGREKKTNGPARIFHMLGRLYQERSVADAGDHDHRKRCLIKSAVLLNAAKARSSNNAQVIQDDLNNLCMHVCRLAGVEKENVTLAEEAILVFREIKHIRQQLKPTIFFIKLYTPELLQSRKIKQLFASSVANMQKKAYKAYSRLMKKLTNICISLKPNVPCKYALVGMGSLAKKEITLYSDFEHVIVLEEGIQETSNYEEILEYFRWFSVIFHLVVINVGETIVPSICLPYINSSCKKSFNWFFDAKTKKGLSFDGMMPCACKFPLGREKTKRRPWKTELIKPLSEMLKYLETDLDVKNEFHLAQMLHTTCFVAGNQDIYEQFQQGTECHETSLDIWQRLVSNDIKKFNPFETLGNLMSAPKWNLKRVIYRSLGLFVEALGNVCKLKGNSSFKIIHELVQANVIDNDFGEDLLFSTAAACYLRLVTYAQKDSQSDYLESPEKTEDFTKIFDKWIGIKPSVFFFKVVLKLHRFTAFKVGIIKYYDYIKLSDLHYHLYSCCLLGQFSDAAIDSKKLLHNATSNIFDVVFASLTLGQCGSNAYRAQDYMKAKEYLTETINHWDTWQEEHYSITLADCGNVDPPTPLEGVVERVHVRIYKETVAHTFNLLGCCLFDEQVLEEGLTKYERALEIAKAITKQKNADPNVAMFLMNIGKCHLSCGRPDEALECFADAANIWKNIGNQMFTTDIDDCNMLINECANSSQNILDRSSWCSSRHSGTYFSRRLSLEKILRSSISSMYLD